jgi:hypothetical protein
VNLADAVAVLERTPSVLSEWLEMLPEGWVEVDEGPDTFSPVDVVGHLVQGEINDWVPRIRHIMEGRTEPFAPFDRFAMREASAGKSLAELLAEFRDRRATSLRELAELELSAEDFARVGLHPELGQVTLEELIATWVVHDLSHIGQIARTMSGRYRDEVGPWVAYLPVLHERGGKAD